ncbi:hypothetical protein PybrP1_006131, partial [[Pythium] brassicae (nom. inval.)]
FRVLAASQDQKDWKAAAEANGISESTAWRIIKCGSVSPRGVEGARASCVKMTANAMAKLEELLEEECCMTLITMQDRL